MKNRISIILLLFLPIVLQAQIGRDAKSWLLAMELEQPHEQPSADFRKYEYSNGILPLSKPLLSSIELYIIIEKGSNFYLKSIPLRKDFKGNKKA